MLLALAQVQEIVDRALAEDSGWGDVTTEALIPSEQPGKASFLVKEKGVLCGLEVVGLVFQRADPSLKVTFLVEEGASIEPGQVVGTVEGAVASILRAERVALNFLQRLSGIATETARYVEAVAGLPVRILDTRKTTPGLRILEKYAIRVGGGHNHRQHLGDGILIKDNHLAALRARGLSLAQAVLRARQRAPHPLKIEVEVTSVAEAKEAVEAGAEVILLDNMPPEQMKEAVRVIAGQAQTEASGGISLETVRAVAESGVDFISIGRLTHSVRSLDISLELETGP